MHVDLTPGPEFGRTAARMRGAPKKVRADLNKAIKTATAPIERAAKRNILALDSKGTRGGGARARGDANAARSRKGARGKTGLRVSIAKGITRQITYTGERTGVRVRADGKYLPPDQRSLIRAMNKGRWRHPVFGDTETWSTQTTTPPRWFDRAVAEHGRKAIDEIQDAARKALESLGD